MLRALSQQAPLLAAVLGLLFLIAPPGSAQAPAAAPPVPSAPLGLDEALAAAFAASPALTAARLGRAEAAARVDVARQRPNPELSIEESRDTPRDAAIFSLPIERGGKRRRRIDLAQAQGRTGEAELARLTAEVRNQVRRAYFALAGAEQRAAETAALGRLAESARDAARARFTSGDVPRLDVLQSELAATQAAGETAKARGLLAGARADLNALLRRSPESPLATSAPLDSGTVPPPPAATDLAQRSSTELAALDLGVAQQKAQIELARAETRPDWTVGAGVTHYAPPDFTWGWRGSLAVPLRVFSRNRAQTRLEEAILARLQAERAAAAARVSGEVYAAAENAQVERQAYLGYRDEILPRAAEVERLAEASYRSGQTGLVALLQSLQSVHDLRLQAVQAGIDYQNALADLERAIGAPLP
jgi:cobalt-zinc-cadmium efflux system outer membrane protein